MIQEVGRCCYLPPAFKMLIQSLSQSLKLKKPVPTGCIRTINSDSTPFNRYISIGQLIIEHLLCLYHCPVHFESLYESDF